MMLRRVLAFVRSPRLAAALIATLLLLSIINVTVPQRALLDDEGYARFAEQSPLLARVIEALGLDRVFFGWPIAIVCTVLFLSLLTCTVQRLQQHMRASVRMGGLPFHEHGSDRALDVAASQLEAHGWRVRADGGRLLAVKGTSGFWGSMLLHLGMLIVIVGGVLTVLGGFAGAMVISEGQQVVDAPESYLYVTQQPRIGPAFTGATLSVEGVEVEYEQGQVVSAVVTMTASGSRGVTTHRARVNHPLDLDGKSYLVQRNGYSVGLVMSAPGAPTDRLLVNLARSVGIGYADTITVGSPAGEVRIEMTATPRPVAAGERSIDELLVLTDPRLRLGVTMPDGTRMEDELAHGESLTLADGLTIEYEETTLWSRFLVRAQRYRWVLYSGFWICVFGAAWRFLVPTQRMTVSMARGELATSLRARPWTPAASQELESSIRSRRDEMAGEEGA